MGIESKSNPHEEHNFDNIDAVDLCFLQSVFAKPIS